MLRTAQQDIWKECQQLSREGQWQEAVENLRQALRRRELPSSKSDAAGRFLRKAFNALKQETLNIHILGQCTTSWLTSSLTTEAWAHGIATVVTDGGYDSLIQDLANLDQRVDVIIMLPWHQRLLASGDRPHAQRINDELALLRQAWSMVPSHARLIQVGYDWVNAGSLGFQLGRRLSGEVRLVRSMNDALVETLPDEAYFVDLEQVSAEVGRRNFYDARNYAWTKQPFSAEGVHELSRHFLAATRAVTQGPKKVLVLDLDNTLWGGVVGELGPLGIELGDSPSGEAFRAFQRHVKQLRDRGIVLAVCSKNNPDDAREPFEVNRDMAIASDDIAAFEASWDPKPVAIARIAEKLNLGLDSFVFFDDNPAEREAVRQQLPMVEVVEAPSDPVDFVSALQAGLWFESASITAADRQRGEQYCAQQYREVERASAGSLPDYLTSLEMTAEVNHIDEQDMQRVVQLLSKTNQFNLTTRRHTGDDVRRMLKNDKSLGLSLRLMDRFGEYGLVSVVLAVPVDGAAMPTLRLDTWLMSCRAIGRTVEHYLMNCVLEQAKSRGFQRIIGEYIPSAKNEQVADFYLSAGFHRAETSEVGVDQFELTLPAVDECATFVHTSP